MIDNIYTLYFDGCSKGNPGEAGAGAVIYYNDVEIWSASMYVGDNETNNVAEYNGLLLGLSEAVTKCIKNIVVYGDSMLVIQQMKGKFKVKSTNLIDYYNKIKELETKFENIEYNHAYRNNNKRADQLSNIGLLQKT